MGNQHKYLQLPRFETHSTKAGAISLVKNHINENIEDFKDGEEIIIEYLGSSGEPMYSTAVVKKNNGTARIYVSIEEHETLKVVESDVEPIDKSVIWLSTAEDEEVPETEGETANLRAEVDLLKSELKKMQTLVNKHDYALASTIAGGDIITNSEKYELENMYEPEQPADAPSYEEYATEDLVVTSYDLYIGNSTLQVYNKLYKGQKYFLKLRMFNSKNEQVKQTTETLTITCTPTNIANVDDKNVLTTYTAGTITVTAKLYTLEGRRIDRQYPLTVEYNEEPDYATYSEPNVKHFVLKTVENPTILAQNANYLCINEPIWCISECALYIKAKAPNGAIKLYKIDGSGGSIEPDTGDTSGDTTSVTIDTTFEIDENGTLVVSTNDENAIYVNEDGILIINVGEVTDEGILTLNDSSSEGGGGGGGDGGDTPDEDSDAIVDGDGELIITGDETAVDANGILLLNATVTPDGILTINA